MKPDDLRIMCTALGLTAVLIKDADNDADDGTRPARVHHLSQLIESYCLVTEPETPYAFSRDIAQKPLVKSDNNDELLCDACDVLEQILNDGLNFSTEQTVEATIKRLRHQLQR